MLFRSLCINNIGLGIGAGMADISILLAPPVSALFSFVFIWAGCTIGKRITNRWCAKALEIAAAVFIVALGISELAAFFA